MDKKTRDFLKKLNPNRIILPILLGIAAFIYLSLTGDEELDGARIWANIKQASWLWIFLSLLVLLIRDVGYALRIRLMSNGELSWTASFYVIILWEFSSAITPSVVGGTAIAVFILNQEGIKFGRSLAYVMTTAVFDNLFFFFASLTALLLLPNELYGLIDSSAMGKTIETALYISLGLISFYSLLMLYGLVISPERFKWLLDRLTRLRLLKRFRSSAMQIASDVITASSVLKDNSVWFWVKAALITLVIWISRYLMLNCIMAAFLNNINPLDFFDHLHILARQIIMWVVMLASPTPGSSGSAELAFTEFFKDYLSVAGLTVVVAGAWRLVTYYLYLVVGAVVLSRWLRRILKRGMLSEIEEQASSKSTSTNSGNDKHDPDDTDRDSKDASDDHAPKA